MYAKLFASLYQGTLRGNAHGILVFTNLLAHCDQYGIVDKHFRAIAEEVGLSVDEVKAAIEQLESPDSESRSPELDGCRITRLDEHRIWGWQVVNYAKYRAIRSEDDRRESNRVAQERWRNKNKPPSAGVSHGKPPSAQEEAEAVNPPTPRKTGGRITRRTIKTVADAEWSRVLVAVRDDQRPEWGQQTKHALSTLGGIGHLRTNLNEFNTKDYRSRFVTAFIETTTGAAP